MYSTSMMHLFGRSSHSSKHISGQQLASAIEYVKLALAALKKGDGKLARERLEQALGVWKS